MIKAEIHEFILRNWRIVKVATTKAQRKLLFTCAVRARRSAGWAMPKSTPWPRARRRGARRPGDGAALQCPDVASDLGPAHADDAFAPSAYLADPRFEPAAALEREQSDALQLDKLGDALDALDPRSRDIVVSRWLNEPKATLHDLAARYGVSAERIRQLETNAFQKMKGVLPAVA